MRKVDTFADLWRSILQGLVLNLSQHPPAFETVPPHHGASLNL
jgi:hypothetical protein